MKAKIKRGSGFRGVLDYALGKDEPRIVGGNMSGQSPRELAKEFAAARVLRPDIEKPVWHSSLSAVPGERLTDQQWRAVADRYMRGMGFSDSTQFVVIRHTAHDDQINPPAPKLTKSGKLKKGGPECEHVHIIASRIDLRAKVWLGQNDVDTAIEQTQQIEREFGLVETKGFDKPRDVKALTRAEAGMADRTGEAPREYLQTTLAAIVATKPTMREFVERAQAAGIELRPNLASSGRMNGFSFGRAGIHFKGQKLGDKFKWPSLSKHIDYQPERDNDLLRQLLSKSAPASEKPVVSPAPAAAVTAAASQPKKPIAPGPAGAKPKFHSARIAVAVDHKANATIEQKLRKEEQASLDFFERLRKKEQESLEKFMREMRKGLESHDEQQELPRTRASAPAAAAASQAQRAERAANARRVLESMNAKPAPAPAAPAGAASRSQDAPPPAAPPAASSAQDEREQLRRIVERAISGKGIKKSDALARASEAGDVGSVDKLLDAGAAVLPKSIDGAAKNGNDALFKKLVGFEGSATDHVSLNELAQKCSSPEARAKLTELAAQAKAQGGHTAGLGIDGPHAPGRKGLSAGPKGPSGPSGPR